MSVINQINDDSKAPALRETVNNLVKAVNQGDGGSVEVFDGLTSDSPSKALSARQGKLLDERITGVVAGNAVAQNPWYGKKYIAIGDSITSPHVNTMKNKYCYYIAKALGTSSVLNSIAAEGLDNIGVSGMTMVQTSKSNTSAAWGDRRSFIHELLYQGETDFTAGVSGNMDPSVGPTGGPIGRGPQGIDWAQYDLATILLGVNDGWDMAKPSPYTAGEMGELYEPSNYNGTWAASDFTNDKDKFCAAYELAVGTILTANPNIRLVLCTPPNVGLSSVAGMFKKIRAIAAAVREIGSRYSCPVIDFYNECGIPYRGQFGSSTFTSDGVHPNAEGHKRLAEVAIGRLLQLKPALPVLS